jgi:hypothetical protein
MGVLSTNVQSRRAIWVSQYEEEQQQQKSATQRAFL